MFRLRDFYHLPQVDKLFEQLIADEPGLVVVAGLDPRLPAAPSAPHNFLPSGRTTLFRILLEEILAAYPRANCTVVAEDKEIIRIPRQLRRRIQFALVNPPDTYAGRILEAAQNDPGLLVIDQLSAETAPAACSAAARGIRVLSQLDTVYRGAAVGRQLLDLGVDPGLLSGLTWVLTVQRMPRLCPNCRKPVLPDASQLARLRHYYPELARLLRQDFSRRWARIIADPVEPLDEQNIARERAPGESQDEDASHGEIGTFYQMGNCSQCNDSGRQGDIAAFDFFRLDPDAPDLHDQPSLLGMDTYVLYLASMGHLALDDFLQFEADQFRRTFNLFVASEQALVESNSNLQRRLVQLEAANRVLEQRTEALISLQAIGQALTSSTSLDDLAGRVCRSARDLCKADRAILYFQRAEERVEVLAVAGWDATLAHQQMETGQVFILEDGPEPVPFNRWPPGVPLKLPADETLRAGLYVPLIAQDRRVGLMIIYSIHKARFEPGEVALLKTLANQAAVAMQRAGLIEQLEDKITQLEAAQAGLVQKERLEREMELARQVQQSVLPRTFPELQGYRFAAHNEPARQVGGDFYDVIPLDSQHFGIAVGDVSDKGMPAALYMTLTRSLLRAEARRERSPNSVITNVNRLLLELGEPNLFVTLFYGVVDVTTRSLAYARAGHDRPVLLRQGSALELGGQGTALGVLEESEFHLAEEQVFLAPGDRLILFTDGLMDVFSPSGELFGHERLLSLLQSSAALPALGLIETVYTSLAAHRGSAEPFDDMTLLVVEVE